MMGGNRVDHQRGLSIALEKIRTDASVTTLDIVVERLADIVEKPRNCAPPIS